jgi:hypothetical protein
VLFASLVDDPSSDPATTARLRCLTPLPGAAQFRL